LHIRLLEDRKLQEEQILQKNHYSRLAKFKEVDEYESNNNRRETDNKTKQIKLSKTSLPNRKRS
jgi:hypothetical protein